MRKNYLKHQIIDPKILKHYLKNLKGKNIIIDSRTCSIFNENIINKKFNIKKVDPCYLLKSKKIHPKLKI